MLKALVVVVLATTVAFADEQQFRAAGQLAAAGDPRAVDAFEAAGAARPITLWTDDAWVEAARLAELGRDYDRARRDLEQAIAVSTDPQLLRRAKRDLARVVEVTGSGGEWSAVAAEHQRLATDLGDGGDPTSALEQLEALAKQHPTYPRAVPMRIAIARAWETEDEVERALRWLRDALAIADDDRARIELVRMLVRHRKLGEARRELALVRDDAARRTLERSLSANEGWQRLRYVAMGILLAIAGLAAFLLRRRGGFRQLARPPIEVIYFVPIATVVGVIALTGNPLVGKAVLWICIGAAAIAWISGAMLEAARRRAPISMRHALMHAAVVGIAVLAAVYLAIDHARLLDLVAETWRTGPGH